jgi:hypothetical protein
VVVHGLTAVDSNLSLAVAAAGSFAALLSVVIAWLVQRDVKRQRQRDDLDTAVKQAILVQSGANHSSHYWGEPLKNYQLAFQRVRQWIKLNYAEQLFVHRPPCNDPSRTAAEAAEVEDLAAKAIEELRRVLAEHS